MEAFEEVAERIEELKSQKAEEVERLKAMAEDLEAKAEKLEAEAQKAEELGDLKAYKKACATLEDTKKDYNFIIERIGRLSNADLTDDQEDEKIISLLLGYEEEKTAAYKKEAGKLLEELKDLTDLYKYKIARCEGTLTEWTSHIKKNYRVLGCYNAKNEIYRSAVPVDIHPNGYTGDELSAAVSQLIASPVVTKTILDH